MIKINGLTVEEFKFPGGEVNVRLPKGLKAGKLNVIAWLESSDDILALFLTTDALACHFGNMLDLHITVPYMPYGRQDRVCSYGEPIGLRVIEELLARATRSNKVLTYDLHNVNALTKHTIIENIGLIDIFRKANIDISPNTVLVAPDLGATEKVKELAGYFDLDWIQGLKERDPSTGELSGFGIDFDSIHQGFDLSLKDLLIVDDICDGGGTFNGLAEVLKYKLNPKSLGLYVTHGIFSKGFEALEENFDYIMTTDTISKQWFPRKGLKIYKVVE